MDPSRLERARRGLSIAGVVAALVPIGLVGGFLVGKYLDREVGIALLALAGLAELVGPVVVLTQGLALHRHRTAPGSPVLVRVAVAMYALMLLVLGFGLVTMVRATREDSMAGLGLAIGGMMLILLSLLPWLVSLVTGGVFTARILREET